MLNQGYILSVASSTDFCSVALHRQGALICSKAATEPRTHGKALPAMIHSLFEQAGLEATDLDAIAFSEGPGSYTGLRIGAALAKGICYAASIPLIPIPTLLLVVERAKQELDFASPPKAWYAILDARKSHLYGMVVAHDGEVLIPLHAGPIAKLQSTFLQALTEEAVWIGSGVDVYGAQLKHKFVEASMFKGLAPSATYMGKLAWHKWQAKEIACLADFAPNYRSAFLG